MKHIILISILVLALGCSQAQQIEEVVEQEAQEQPEVEEVVQEEPEEVALEEPTEEIDSCEVKAAELFPDKILLELPAGKEAEIASWRFADDQEFSDETAIELKGKVTFSKGKLAGEKPDQWYLRNDHNEKLFGVGGVKYQNTIKQEDANYDLEVYFKPTLKPIEDLPEVGNVAEKVAFEVVDIGIASCSLEQVAAVIEDVELDLNECEQKAMQIIPESLELELPQGKDSSIANWRLVKGQSFDDETPLDYKGTITFTKGKDDSENLNFWYTRNSDNEKLYGEGGLKYEKQVTVDGVIAKNKFIIKPVLRPLADPPKLKNVAHSQEFKVVKPGFVSCELS